MQFLTDNFLSEYPTHPDHMSPLGLFTFYRTYSRFLPEEKRRETWKETVARAVEYNVGLEYKHREKIGLPIPSYNIRKEAEQLFDSIFNLKQFPSGRTLWIGGTPVAEKYPMSNFNCSFTNVEKWEDISEIFYLLMLGSGVGFKATYEMMEYLPPIRVNTKLILSEYKPVPVDYRLENTDTRFLENGFAKIYVGDSKEGWRDSLTEYIKLLTEEQYEHIHTIKISFNSVRPAGERLKTFGGRASGPEPLQRMFQGIDDILKNKVDPTLEPILYDEKGYGKVRPVHILDFGNFIGASVVAGGVRRTAEIFLFDGYNFECLFSKYAINGFWTEEHFLQHEKVWKQLSKMGMTAPSWFEEVGRRHYDENVNGDKPYNFGRQNINHRRMSNNSIAFTRKPSEDVLKLIFLMIQLDGEPGFINMESASIRRDNMEGVNPCGEILLDTKQQCNLTTINVHAFKLPDGSLDINELLETQALSARCGFRMTLLDLELPEWEEKHKRDRLAGCSLTGVQDAFAGIDKPMQKTVLNLLRQMATSTVDDYARELRVPTSLLVTTVKPEGTLSLVAGGVSAGVHDAHSPYFIRRIRISPDDALAQAVITHGWTVHPEIGTPDNDIAKARTLVVDFPIKSGATRTKDDVSAIEQLERYVEFQKNYTQHNSSNTITVRPEEWDGLRERISEVWDDFVGVSFLALDGGTYQLAPYEAITEEEYEKMAHSFMPFDPAILQLYESTGISELDSSDPDCATGGCPTR